MSLLERGLERGADRTPRLGECLKTLAGRPVVVEVGQEHGSSQGGTTVGVVLAWRISREAWIACGGVNLAGVTGGTGGEDVLLEVVVRVPSPPSDTVCEKAGTAQVYVRMDAGAAAHVPADGLWVAPGPIEVVVQSPAGREDLALLHLDCGDWLRATVKLDATTLEQAGEARLLFARTGVLKAMGLPGGRYEPLHARLVR